MDPDEPAHNHGSGLAGQPTPPPHAGPGAAAPDRPVVLFDGVCNLCNGAVQVILDHDRRGVLLLAASQSAAGQRLLGAVDAPASAASTILLVEGGRVHARSTAILRIARAMGFPFSLLYALIVVPRALRDLVYDWIARNRYRWFGRQESCRLPRPGELERFLS